MRYLFAITLLGLTLAFVPVSSAQSAAPTVQDEVTNTKTGLQGALKVFTPVAKQAGFPEGAVPPEVLIGQLIRSLIMLMGVIFGVLVVYAGFLWMTARGDDTQVKKSKSILESAVIGIIVVVAAYAITTFVVDRVISSAFQQSATNETPTLDDPCANITCTNGETCAAGICSGG